MKENGCKNSTGLTYFNQTAALKRSGSDYARLPFSHIKSHRALLQVKWIELDLDAFAVSLSFFFLITAEIVKQSLDSFKSNLVKMKKQKPRAVS